MNDKVKARAQDLFTQETFAQGLLQCQADPLHSQGIFGPDIDISLVGPDGVTGDNQSFDQGMRVRFQYGAIHKSSRVAFIGIADDIFLFSGSITAELPFPGGGKPGAAAAAQAGVVDLLDHLLRGHLQKSLPQGTVPSGSNRVFNFFRIDPTAIAQNDPCLFLIKIYLAVMRNGLTCYRVMIEKALYRDAVPQVRADNFGHILDLHIGIKNSVRLHHYAEPLGTEAVAVAAAELDCRIV